jgi:hypothetical protein
MVTALVVALIVAWTGTAPAQTKPGCGPQASATTPEKVAGQIVKVDVGLSKLTVRGADGTVHEFQAEVETLRDLAPGDRIEARLRPVPTCR